MKNSEIRAALNRKYIDVKFSKKANGWTMKNPEIRNIAARNRGIFMKAEVALAEASDIVAFYQE